MLASEGPRGPQYVVRGKGPANVDAFPNLPGAALGEDRIDYIPTPDGLTVTTILTTPRARAFSATVVLIHGGPWSRDEAGFNETVASYVERGLAVLRVNFRGSTGFGRTHVDAGDGQWGDGMLNDVELAIAAHAQAGRIDVNRIVFVGHSYGGFAALKLATRAFRPLAVVALAPVIDLCAYVERLRGRANLSIAARIGVLPRDSGRLAAQSPSADSGDYPFPTLIAWGEQDARLEPAGISRFAEALAAKGDRVTTMSFPDEGHLFKNARTLAAIDRWLSHTLQMEAA